MNELRNGINTRLETKNKFDEIRSQFIDTRIAQDHNIIKPINQDDYANFHTFNKSFNKAYDDYKEDSVSIHSDTSVRVPEIQPPKSNNSMFTNTIYNSPNQQKNIS